MQFWCLKLLYRHFLLAVRKKKVSLLKKHYCKCSSHLVMQVRVRTEAPPPQVREHTDQPLHGNHSFLRWSCRRARRGRPNNVSADRCHEATRDTWGGRTKQKGTCISSSRENRGLENEPELLHLTFAELGWGQRLTDVAKGSCCCKVFQQIKCTNSLPVPSDTEMSSTNALFYFQVNNML